MTIHRGRVKAALIFAAGEVWGHTGHGVPLLHIITSYFVTILAVYSVASVIGDALNEPNVQPRPEPATPDLALSEVVAEQPRSLPRAFGVRNRRTGEIHVLTHHSPN